MYKNYDKIECVCGKKARVVECGVGYFVHCPSCDRSTPMAWDREKVEREWKELMDSYQKADKMGGCGC